MSRGALKFFDFFWTTRSNSPILASRSFIRSSCLGKLDHLLGCFLHLPSDEVVSNDGLGLLIADTRLAADDIGSVLHDLSDPRVAAGDPLPRMTEYSPPVH